MSSLLQLYQSSTRCIGLSFTDDDGFGVNMSGSVVAFTAKRSYSDPLTGAVISKLITGDATSVSGSMTMCFTTGDTSICSDIYNPAGFTVFDTSGNISPIPIDGLEILPSPMGYSP